MVLSARPAFCFCLLACARTAFADPRLIDCGKRSLADAIERADVEDTISFTGVCAGPLLIRTDNLTLTGVGTAVIDGQGKDAVTVAGAHGIALSNLEIRNGQNGFLGLNGAHATLTNVSSRNNVGNGISLQTSSSLTLSGVSVRDNGVHGLALETGSAATITGSFTASGNRVFGINVNGSALTFSRATVTASGNALGIQVATNANAFLNDPSTVVNVSGNFATGLTVVSGGHVVSFGGTINATGNPLNGVSVNSKGGLDLDAGSVLNSSNNGGDGVVLQEQSVMTVFNIPQFSRAPGFSTVNANSNGGNGLRVQTGSTLTLANQAKVNSIGNKRSGVLGDNGATLTLLNSVATGNTLRDLQLTFGTRADLQNLSLGTWACDVTVQVRGDSGVTCPH